MEAFAFLFNKNKTTRANKLDTQRAKALFFHVPSYIKRQEQQQSDTNEESFHSSYGLLFLKTLCLLTEAVST